MCQKYGKDLKRAFENGEFKLKEVLCFPKTLYDFSQAIVKQEGSVIYKIPHGYDVMRMATHDLNLNNPSEITQCTFLSTGDYKLRIKYIGHANQNLKDFSVKPIFPPICATLDESIPLPFACFYHGADKYKIMKDYKILLPYNYRLADFYDSVIIKYDEIQCPTILAEMYDDSELLKGEFKMMLYALGMKDLNTKTEQWVELKKENSIYSDIEQASHFTKYVIISKDRIVASPVISINEKLDRIIQLLESLVSDVDV